VANAVKWTTATSRTSGISSESISAGANNLGDEVDNSSNKDRFASFSLIFTCATAPTAGKVMELYIVYAIDGTNYEAGDATPTDPVKIRAGVFPARNVTAAQRVNLTNVPLAPFKLKCLLKSELDQNATSVTMQMYTHNEEIQ
jgi:hypothetical protein